MNMIERVARAICTFQGQDPDRLEPGDSVFDWEGIDGILRNGDVAHFVWRERVGVARAALEAIREQNHDILIALSDNRYDVEPGGVANWTIHWHSIIDAALNEPLSEDGGEKQ